MYYFLAFVVGIVAVVFILTRYTRLEFVAHAKLLWKAWSIWLASFGSLLSAWVQSFPDAALNAWVSLPQDVKDIIPHNYLGLIGAFMVAMGVISQFVRQNKLQEQRKELEKKDE